MKINILDNIVAFNSYIIIDQTESESEPVLEIWEEGEDELLHDTEPPDAVESSTSFDHIPSSSCKLDPAIFYGNARLPDVVIGYFLHFFVMLFGIIGQYCNIGRDIAKCLLRSVYKAKQVQCFVVCRKCFSIYQFSQCIESSGSHRNVLLSDIHSIHI